VEIYFIDASAMGIAETIGIGISPRQRLENPF